MGEVVRLFPRKKRFRGLVRECVSDAMRTAGKPIAVVVVAMADDGFNIQCVKMSGVISTVDVYSRASAIVAREASAALSGADEILASD